MVLVFLYNDRGFYSQSNIRLDISTVVNYSLKISNRDYNIAKS